jgi:hypothetical protein
MRSQRSADRVISVRFLTLSLWLLTAAPAGAFPRLSAGHD